MTLEHATCARLPAQALTVLAGLRRVEGISIIRDGEFAWVIWDQGDDRVLQAVLPVEGVELFEKHDRAWHRAGRRLPSFEGEPPGEPVSLAGAVIPASFVAERPTSGSLASTSLRLRRDARPRPTSAALCPLVELGRWVDSAPSGEIGSIRGAVRGNSAFLIGRSLPAWLGSTRYWGGRFFVPIGFEVWPALPEATLIESFGDASREVFRVLSEPRDEGDVESEGEGLAVEAIPLEAFRPLTRAGVRLALVGISTS